jgi:hypothetical protein
MLKIKVISLATAKAIGTGGRLAASKSCIIVRRRILNIG